MNAAANAQMNAPAHIASPHLAQHRDAVRWVARQLTWERTLDVLRGERRTDLECRAA